MTVTIGGITLSNDLALRGLDDLKPIAQNFLPTLAGGTVVQQMAITSGHSLSLVADDRGGFITYGESVSIRALQAAGNPIVLVHPRGTYEVMVEQVNWEPLVDFVDKENSDQGLGSIELIVKTGS